MNLLPAIQKAGHGLPRFLLKRCSLLKRIFQLLWIFVCVKAFLWGYLLRDEGRQVFLHIWPDSERGSTLNQHFWMILLGVLIIEGLVDLLRKFLLGNSLFPFRWRCTFHSRPRPPPGLVRDGGSIPWHFFGQRRRFGPQGPGTG